MDKQKKKQKNYCDFVSYNVKSHGYSETTKALCKKNKRYIEIKPKIRTK